MRVYRSRSISLSALLCPQLSESLQFCGLAQVSEWLAENQLRLIVGQIFVVAEDQIGLSVSLVETLLHHLVCYYVERVVFHFVFLHSVDVVVN